MNRRQIVKACLAGTIALNAGPTRPALPTRTSAIKIAMTTPADLTYNGVYVWVKTYADIFEKFGHSVKIYPNSALGGDRERIFQTQLGLLETNMSNSDEIMQWSPHAYALSRPFAFSSYAHMDRFLTTTGFIDRVTDDLKEQNLTLLDFVYTGSMVGLFTRGNPVRTLSDLRPLRLRVLSAADQDLLDAWRVRGVQVAWEEVAQALQTGMVDAYLNPPNVAPMFGHGEVLDHFTNLNMGPAARIVVVPTKWLNGLAAVERKILNKAVAEARRANRLWTQHIQITDRKRLESIGIRWVSLNEAERKEWIEASLRLPTSKWERSEATAQVRQWIEQTRDATK